MSEQDREVLSDVAYRVCCFANRSCDCFHRKQLPCISAEQAASAILRIVRANDDAKIAPATPVKKRRKAKAPA